MKDTNGVVIKQRNPVIRYIKDNSGVLIALALLVIGISLASQYFLTAINM